MTGFPKSLGEFFFAAKPTGYPPVLQMKGTIFSYLYVLPYAGSIFHLSCHLFPSLRRVVVMVVVGVGGLFTELERGREA